MEGTHTLAGRYLSKNDFHAHTFERLNNAKSGMQFDNRYCWVIRFKEEMIVEVRAHLDSALVQKLIDENAK